MKQNIYIFLFSSALLQFAFSHPRSSRDDGESENGVPIFASKLRQVIRKVEAGSGAWWKLQELLAITGMIY